MYVGNLNFGPVLDVTPWSQALSNDVHECHTHGVDSIRSLLASKSQKVVTIDPISLNKCTIWPQNYFLLNNKLHLSMMHYSIHV